jgi:hypothetical protein
MRSSLLCGASCEEAPLGRHLDRMVLRITERDVREAISLSVALKRPDRNFGAIMASRASSFTDGSARVYISVVCMWACPSQSATFRSGDPSEGPAIRLNRGVVDGAQSLSSCHGNRLASIQYR